MFSKAIAEAKEYTRSVIPIFKFANGKVESTVGTFIHIDDAGHILSARHIFTKGSEDEIDQFSFIFDRQYTQAESIAEDVPNDLKLLRLRDYKPGSIKVFPKFLKGTVGELSNGTQLVRLGYPLGNPYSNVAVTWDEAKKHFHWDADNTKLTCFHSDGFITGYADRENDVRLLETSSPALLGQSGGPVLTAQGVVVGLQSRNSVFESLVNPPVETGLAASHIAIARFLGKHTAAQAIWI
jgi:S1-C subfamily serine protease